MAVGEFFSNDLGNNGGVYGASTLIPTGTNFLMIMTFGVSHSGLSSIHLTVSAIDTHLINHNGTTNTQSAGVSGGGSQGGAKWIISNTNYYTNWANYAVSVQGVQIQ